MSGPPAPPSASSAPANEWGVDGGYGASSFVHADWSVDLVDNLPIDVIIVDAEDRIRGLLPQLDELVTEGMIILDEVEVLRYTGKPRP